MTVPLPWLGLGAAFLFRDLHYRVCASFFDTCPARVCECIHMLQQCPPLSLYSESHPAALMGDVSVTKIGTFWVFPYGNSIGTFDVAATITIRNKRERIVFISSQ